MNEPFHRVGAVADSIDVRLSYRIIQLFSEGLYSSPNKAVEELVVNSFDAGAINVHVIVSADLAQSDASIAVIDDGTGMTVPELQNHWIVGASTKRESDHESPHGRRPIGKFGIGKLASYVLANRLTHITKVEDHFYSVSMDYSRLPNEPLGYIPNANDNATGDTTEHVRLAVRELAEDQAIDALQPWISSIEGPNSPDLFGAKAVRSWTIAIMSDLKPMASDIRLGRLKYVLRTAMPLRDDFHLCLNGEQLESYRVDQERLGYWILGKDLFEVPRPSPQDLELRIDSSTDDDDPTHFGLSNGELGRVSGYVEIFEEPIDTGKSTALIGRSNGFFVYARGRLLNTDESGFGIDRNLLRHGTFSRTRIVLHADRLDNELRSSRESIREGEVLTQVRHLLHGLFNFARAELTEYEEATDPTLRLVRRLAASPASVAERPIILGVREAMAKELTLRTVTYPAALESSDQEAFVDSLRARAETDVGLISKVVLSDLTNNHSIALLSVDTGVLEINTLHPFVANFIEDFVDSRRNLPLELLAASEVVLEMSLLASGLEPASVERTMSERDQLLREIARTRGRPNALTVAGDLLDSVNDKDALEDAVIAAFDSLGFHAVPKGGRGNPDGIAEAPLAARAGVSQRYKISLEAKSKEKSGTRVTKDAVKVSTVARHRNDNGCNWSAVIGPDFSTSLGPESAVLREIAEDYNANDGSRGITLIRAEDLARLVRLAPSRRITLSDLRELFSTCRSPDDAAAWIDGIATKEQPTHHYKEILDTIWEEQQEDEFSSVSYGALRSALRRRTGIVRPDDQLQEFCRSLMQMAPGHVYATDRLVELTMPPTTVLAAIGHYLAEAQE